MSSKPSTPPEVKAVKTNGNMIVLRGQLRKKGLIFNNEREVTLSGDGILNYYHLDKPGQVKGTIDLTSVAVQSVRFN